MRTNKLSILYRHKDTRWLLTGAGVLLLLFIWDVLFLNRPALKQVLSGSFNTFFIALLVVVATLVLGWAVTLSLHFLVLRKRRLGYLVLTFLINLVRSIPQIVGILFGYILVAYLVRQEILQGRLVIFPLMALIMSLFIFTEIVDLMQERIAHFRQTDFYNAMRVCGISESRIINFDILWKNSRLHILNKLISVFGMAVFLQCSVDFIISVGLSTDVNAVTLPTTLGSLLAKIDSKQDILAIGYTLTHPTYFFNLFFKHLQGMTVAFLIVFTLICIYHVSSGYAERHKL
jgi:ABC-type dipeptide/oligopeptide/nickel transport system permease subunit